MSYRKRVTTFLIVLILLLPLVGCGAQPQEEAPAKEEQEPMANMANPFIDCSSASEVAEIAGFDVTFPESVPGYEQRLYQAVEGEMGQCFYHNGEGSARVLVRKGVGEDDLSGDYGEYAKETTVAVDDFELTERGDGTLVYVAIWTRDGYSFAINADEGLDAPTIEGLARITH